jgi:hypothetical protein
MACHKSQLTAGVVQRVQADAARLWNGAIPHRNETPFVIPCVVARTRQADVIQRRLADRRSTSSMTTRARTAHRSDLRRHP